MPTPTKTDITVNSLIVNKLTLAQYKEAKENGQISQTESYEITDIDDISSTVETDDVTIDTNSTTNKIQAIGTIEKNANVVKYDWIGTLAEWTAGRNNNTIPDSYVCFVTDD